MCAFERSEKGMEFIMKKSMIIGIVAIVAVVLITIGGVVFTKLNKEKPSIDAQTFKTTMEEKGYQLADAKSQFSEYDYIEKVYLAADSNFSYQIEVSLAADSKFSYQIEFYQLVDNDYANQFYITNMTKFENAKSSSSIETTVNGKNYSKYTLLSNGKYMVISAINNTAIYVNVDESHKEEVDNILNELGY